MNYTKSVPSPMFDLKFNFTEIHHTALNKRSQCKSGMKQKEMWMGRGWGGWGIEAPVFTTSWFLSFPFMSKQRKWDSAAPSRTVVHSWTGLTQCGPDNHRILHHPRDRYFFCKHRRFSSPRCLTQGAKNRQQQKKGKANRKYEWMNSKQVNKRNGVRRGKECETT